METNSTVVAMRPDHDEGHPGFGPAAPRAVSSLHRFTPYRGDAVEADTVATGCVLLGMLCFAGLLFAGCFDVGLFA